MMPVILSNPCSVRHLSVPGPWHALRHPGMVRCERDQ
jgi:hypothetical protein